jgi:hypothetical protein
MWRHHYRAAAAIASVRVSIHSKYKTFFAFCKDEFAAECAGGPGFPAEHGCDGAFAPACAPESMIGYECGDRGRCFAD